MHVASFHFGAKHNCHHVNEAKIVELNLHLISGD